MERQRSSERSNDSIPNDNPDGSGLGEIRDEMADIYHQVDHVLDSIGHLDAQQYLEQNRQTGGQ